MSVSYNGTAYYYVTNIQGDVIKIVNASGTTVVDYTYDTWGALQATTGSMASTLGKTNPLRYRGYVYDQETDLYYLQSRYYDPTIGRFINADAFTSTGQGIIGINMFAYCGNKPVDRVDACGTAYDESSGETPDGYRVVGAGLQFEVDYGNMTVGFEIIVYWDVEECSEGQAIIAIYSYSGVSANFLDKNLGSIVSTIKDNISTLTSGTTDAISTVVDILTGKYSVSISGLLLLGTNEFTSVTSYEGPFVSMYGSFKHIKGSVAVSNNCIAIGIGTTSDGTPSLGFSVTNYTLRGTMVAGNASSGAIQVSI